MRPVLWCVAAALPLLLFRAGLLGLADPSEARYGQISREMAEGGDWLVPTWQRIPHLEKPPLAYWAGALGIRLFGRNELAVRLGAVLALIASAALSAGIARRVAGAGAVVPTALAMLVAPLPVAAGAACMTDPFLLGSATLFHHSVIRRLHGGSRWALVTATLGLALGFLAKGHMILLFTVVPLALAGTGLFRGLWRRRGLLLLATALLLAITVPWFAWIEVRFPGFLRQQAHALGGRALGSGHKAPVYVYALALAAGLFPFVIYAPRGLIALMPGSWRATPPAVRLLLLWLLVPFVVFTATPSRLWTYILPAVPPLAIFAGARLGSNPGGSARWLPWACAGTGAALLLASLRVPLLGHLGAAALLCAAWLRASRRLSRAVAVAGVSMLGVAGFVDGAYFHEGLFQTHRGLARDVARLSRDTGRPVIVAGMSLPSIGFYCDAPVTIAGETGPLAREAETWGHSELFLPGADLAELLAKDEGSVIVVKESKRASLAPQRIPVLLADDLAVLCGSGSGPVRPPR